MRQFTHIFLLGLGLISWGWPAQAQEASIEEKVQALLSEMTVKEKAGQMAQFSIDVISKGVPYNLAEPHALVDKKLQKVIGELGTGSLLNVGGHAYSREHWYEIHQAIDAVVQKTRLKIPVLYGIDAIHGANYTLDATLLPQQLALAATWDPEMARLAGKITAYETRASGIPWNFSPVLDVMRQPLWSRVFETFGEDVYLAKQMGVAMVQGYEGDDISDPYRVASCMKHFLGYSMPFAGKDRSPAHMGMIELREYFLPTFQAAVDAGAKTIMINSAEIDGIPVHANPDILTGVLREELGFKGVAVSDWEDIILLVSRHRVAENHKEAIKMAVNAGVDMSMVPLDLRFVQFLTELIEEGEIPMSRIDEAVGRILTLKMELGLFENIVYDFEEYPEFASESHAQAAYEAALASMTLLKNEKNTLPLAKSSKVLLTGPGAHSLVSLNGPWSRTWQGTDPSYDTEGKLTTYQAIQQKIGAENVSYVEGAKWNEAVDIKAAVKAARKVDYVIVCLAEMPATEKPGDIPDLNWPAAQQELLEAMIATKKPVILVLNEARPRIIHPYIPQVKGILQAYQPGHEGGRAIASVLFGDYNPEGKLPYTYHSSANSLIPYDRKTTSDIYIDFSYNGFRPSYPFGFGLSYTTFAYSNLKLDKEELWGNEPMTITVDVKNTGKRAGKEVVQLYVRDHVASVTPSDRRLRGFDKISLEPGEKKTVSFTLYPEELAFIGRDETWTTESGTFTVFIGDKKASFEYKK